MIRVKNPNYVDRLPDEYQEVEYIESTGTQHIDTGWNLSASNYANNKIVIDADFGTASNGWAVTGLGGGTNIIYVGVGANRIVYYGNGTSDISTGVTYTENRSLFELDLKNKTLKVTDMVTNQKYVDISITTATPTTAGNFHLFCYHNVYSNANFYHSAQLYGAKRYENGVLVSDFIPCYRKSDNIPGLYDLVNNSFYINAGTGTFLVGKDINKKDVNIKPTYNGKFLKNRYVGGKLVYGEPLVNYEYRWVAVGDRGNSAYSIDGETWTSMNGGSSYDDFGVAYGNNRFVKVGRYGDSYYSIDGINWIAMTGLASALYYGVAYGNNRFVCVGESGKSYYITDGETWNGNNGIASANFYGVCYGNDRFVAVGASGKSYYSTDGISWTAMSGASRDLYGVTYGNGMFVAVGTVGGSYYSTNGETWTFSSLGNDIMNYGVAYGNGTFVAIANNGSLSKYSTNGTSWSNVSGLSSNAFHGITYGNDRFIAVGESGASYYSMDGKTWTAMTGLANATYYGICYGRKAVPKYSQLKNYTMLYDSGDECTDLTGGWEIFQNKTDSSVTVTKNSDNIYLARPNLGVSYSPEGGVKTVNMIDCTNFVKCGILARDYTCKNVVPKFFIEQSDGTAENLLFAISYHTQSCPYHTSPFTGNKMFLVDLILKESTKFCMRCMGGNQGTASVYFLNLVLYKQDDWQKLCSIAGLTADSYASESALCSDSTAINTILNNEDAVKFMIYNCTGTFMATAVLSSTFLTALNNSPYNTIIQANKHWNKFLAMVA